MDHWESIRAERLELADLMDGFDDAQWATASLCAAWTVRDVAAHLVVPNTVSKLDAVRFAVAARGSFHRASEAMVARAAQRPTAELVRELRRTAGGRFAPPGLGSVAPLTDVLVHGQDIRIPLGIDDARPAAPWLAVLDFLMTSKARLGFLPRRPPALRLVTLDGAWSHGTGPEVTGTPAALALTLLGRAAWSDRLTGPGAAALARFAAGSGPAAG